MQCSYLQGAQPFRKKNAPSLRARGRVFLALTAKFGCLGGRGLTYYCYFHFIQQQQQVVVVTPLILIILLIIKTTTYW